jgi:DNA-binding PadR family transcriptional regulator
VKNKDRDRPAEPPSAAAFHILLALADGDQHGYAIMHAVADGSSGRVRLAPGTLYRTLKHLLETGWIAEAVERPDPELDDERRRYYRLTATGRRAAAIEADRLATLVRLAQSKRLLHATPETGGLA